MRRIFTLLALILFAWTTGLAQTAGRISGSVKDKEGKFLPAATVSLLRARDSSLVKIAVSDKAGLFKFINIREGRYLLSVTSVGFGKAYSSAFDAVTTDIDLSSVSLSPTSNDLNNVTVT